jgi:hypothetical protein
MNGDRKKARLFMLLKSTLLSTALRRKEVDAFLVAADAGLPAMLDLARRWRVQVPADLERQLL